MSLADIGSVLGGRYRLVELLGQGGMATIYRGQDSQLGRDVAVKVLRPEYGRDPDFLARFRQEAQAVASLNDPNIVAVYDFGQEAAGPFIVMEYVEGEDLATLLRRTGSLAPRQAARIARDVARALEAAHQRGIVHRDVKPGNILISGDGRVKVTDFGIARALSEAQLTLPGTTLGSVHYLSPEQVRGEPASASSDIYGLGIVLYEMLTGRRPWEGETAASVAMGRLSGPPPAPSDVIAAIPPALDAIDRKALAIDPGDRFSSAAAFADALNGFLVSTAPAAVGGGPAVAGVVLGGALAGGVPAAGPPPGGPPQGGPAGGPATASGGARPAPPARRTATPPPYPADAYARPLPAPPSVAEPPGEGTSPWVWVSGLVGLLVIVVAGFLIYQLMISGGPTAPAAEQVSVPSLVGRTIDDARVTASSLGIELVTTPQQAPDQPIGTILTQDPPPNTTVDKGSQVQVTVATGTATVSVPDLRLKTETEALAAIFAAGLSNGTRSEAYDPVVPAGSIVSQDPQAGLQVAREGRVNYVVSKGPEPSPSATSSPTATPEATIEPTPTPTPTPVPTPAPLIVGDYRCLTLDAAAQQMATDGFVLGTVTTDPPGGAADGSWQVKAQVPTPGEARPPGTSIRVTVIPPTNPCP